MSRFWWKKRSGREFTIGVFRTKGQVITLPITEIITKNEFFDFEAKYQGASEEVTPAVLMRPADKIRAEAKRHTRYLIAVESFVWILF